MTGPEHERYRDDVGAYLLGALSELEARGFERHTAVCPECRDELDELRPAAEAMASSPDQFEAPPSLKRSLMATVRAEARERAGARAPASGRWLSRIAMPWPRLAWVATALVFVGVGLGVGIDSLTRGGASERVVTARVDSAALPGGRARLVLRDGRPTTLRVSGLPVLHGGRVYEVWIDHGGAVRPAGALFEVHSDGGGAAAIPGAASGDRVLVTRERAGGANRPTERPVINAQA